MTDPVFWLGLSVGLVAAAIFALVVTLLPAIIQLSRAAASIERFFDTLLRELPPTLEALRLTSLDVSDIADSVDDGVKGASQVVKRVNQSVEGVQVQAQQAQVNARSVWAGIGAAWRSWNNDTSLSSAKQLPASSGNLVKPPASPPRRSPRPGSISRRDVRQN